MSTFTRLKIFKTSWTVFPKHTSTSSSLSVRVSKTYRKDTIDAHTSHHIFVTKNSLIETAATIVYAHSRKSWFGVPMKILGR
jgi:hypothetical protein